MTYDRSDEERARERGLTVEKLVQIQATYALSNREISELSEGALRRLLYKLKLADRPRARAEFERLFELGDEGAPMSERKLEALATLARSRAATSVERCAGVPVGEVRDVRELSPAPARPRAAGLEPGGGGWTSLGPGRVGGRTRSIVVDPRDPDRIWLGSVGGGVWRSANGGANWHPVDDRMANLAVCSMAMDPTDPDTLYAGTGEGFFNLDALRGAGIFRTSDGTAWSQIPATANADFHWVNRLALSPDGAVLLAATRSGLHRSDDPDRAQWTRVADGNFTDVRFDPTEGALAVAAQGMGAGGAFFSTDGGLTWALAIGFAWPPERVELAYAARDPATVYASVDVEGGRLLRSTDGGQTYAECGGAGDTGAPVPFLGQQGWYDNVLWAGDPADADLVIVGGVDLWRSFDGGATLARMSDWRRDASAHADHHAIVAHPDYDGAGNRTVFFGNDGGIYRADDVRTVGSDPERTAGWVNLVNGYAVTQFYGVAGNAGTGVLVGGAQDNGSLAFRPAAGPDAWVEILGGDGGFCGAHPGDAQVFYTEYVHLDLNRNTNGAASDDRWWENYISGSFFNDAIGDWDRKPLPFRIPDAGSNASLFIAPFVVDPNDGDRILAGGTELWRTEDATAPNSATSGPSWASIKPPMVGHGAPNRVSAIAVAAGDSDRVWVGYERGTVFATGNGSGAAPTWTRVSGTGASPLTPARMCTRLVIDPSDADRVYATFAGYVAENVWRTDDGGVSWIDLSAGLPAVPMRSLAVHPRRPDFVYLGTELGIFTSEDFGATWSPANEGPTNCAVAELLWMGEVLVAATHGRGMFSIDLAGVPAGP